MQFHLDHEHRAEASATILGPTEPPKKKRRSIQTTLLPGGVPATQRLSTTKSTTLDNLLMRLMTVKVLPLSLVDHPDFRAFVAELDTR